MADSDQRQLWDLGARVAPQDRTRCGPVAAPSRCENSCVRGRLDRPEAGSDRGWSALLLRQRGTRIVVGRVDRHDSDYTEAAENDMSAKEAVRNPWRVLSLQRHELESEVAGEVNLMA